MTPEEAVDAVLDFALGPREIPRREDRCRAALVVRLPDTRNLRDEHLVLQCERPPHKGAHMISSAEVTWFGPAEPYPPQETS